MNNVEGFVLAGGASSRMGKDKALLTLGGKTFVERAAFALRAVSQNLCLVGDNLKGEMFLPTAPDVHKIKAEKKRASIIGVHSALFHAQMQWAAILACDLPFVTGELLTRLADLGKIYEKSDLAAVVPIQPDGKIQPLCAFYKPAVCLPRIEEMLAARKFRLQEIFGKIKTKFVEFSEIADLPNAKNFFFNVNTPEDLRRAEKIERRLIS